MIIALSVTATSAMIAIVGTAIIDNTTISGNHAAIDPDVDGTFSS